MVKLLFILLYYFLQFTTTKKPGARTCPSHKKEARERVPVLSKKIYIKGGQLLTFSIQKKYFTCVTARLNIDYDFITLCLIFPLTLPHSAAHFAPQCFRLPSPLRFAATIFRGRLLPQKCPALLFPCAHSSRYIRFHL